MGLFNGCLLASDVDGTLVANGYINPENIEQIEFFIKEGGCFSLSSGRSAGALIYVARHLKAVSPSVCANGAVIYDFKSQKILSQHTLKREDYRIAQIIFEKFPDVGIEVHSGMQVLAVRQNKFSAEHQIYEKLEPIELSLEQAIGCAWNKVLYACNSKEQQGILKEIITKEKTDCVFATTCAELNGRTDYYFEQLPVGISKIAGINELCKMLNIKKGGLFAIGDYYNDAQMLQGADLAAAPVDSPEDIKSLADYHTVPCKDGAVADFIKYLTRKRLKEI